MPRTSTLNNVDFQKISNQEAKDHQPKGLCFNCNEKFTPSHHCQHPQLFMIEDSLEKDMDLQSDEATEDETMLEISIHAIEGAIQLALAHRLGLLITLNPILQFGFSQKLTTWLTKLLTKAKFYWTPRATESFKRLKQV
ncbi:hypothetical protein FEM48_Zijuj06G0175700 [Ziziphus jujuba var. spinosa]|uniref:Uncharacterized protein n=1 Tax=Ziziphus jujuba var. spinosa TaxID=714518 RepID=A0A978VAN5_ZIZJJ|nr:hypothetical protein FEM48_Zijuj06G0175700 [Ziziphus jujuba var. spinosa]